MSTYTITVERVMRDTFEIEADTEDEARDAAHEEFCEAHREHEYDETSVTVDSSDEDDADDEEE